MGTRSEDLLILYEEYLARSGQSSFTIKSYLSDLKLFHKWYQETYAAEQVDHTVFLQNYTHLYRIIHTSSQFA